MAFAVVLHVDLCLKPCCALGANAWMRVNVSLHPLSLLFFTHFSTQAAGLILFSIFASARCGFFFLGAPFLDGLGNVVASFWIVSSLLHRTSKLDS